MKVKRIVSTGFWTDEKVIYWTPEDKYFMLYLLTNPHSEPCGVYELPPKIAGFEMGYSEDAVKGLLDRFENKYGVIARRGCEIAIKNFLKYSTVKGGKPIFDCLMKSAKGVKHKELLSIVKDHLKDCGELNSTVKDFLATIDTKEKESSKEKESTSNSSECVCVCVCDNTQCTVDRTLSVREPYTQTDQEEPTPQPKKSRSKRFVKPTVDEVRAYCLERQNDIDPEYFIDYYEARGWVVGKTPMKDWKATVRTWEKRERPSTPYKGRYKTRDERLREDDARRERMCKEYDEQHSQSSFEDIKRLLSK